MNVCTATYQNFLFLGSIPEKKGTGNKNFCIRYRYDALNRITGAIDNTGNYNLDLVEYDKNGNILILKRNGHLNNSATSFGVMDDLSYSYDGGNKLEKVDDLSGVTTGFKDISGTDYTYDVNGNMISDANKYIINIEYNHLNLPTRVSKAWSHPMAYDSGSISYVYSADGQKLSKTVSRNGNFGIINTTTTYYAGNYIYESSSQYSNGMGFDLDPELQFFSIGEGYVKKEGSNFSYVYQIKDHLGNVRISYADTNVDGVIDPTTEIIEENNYYPFGMKIRGYNNVVSSNGNSTAQKFKYNGVELEESLGLNLYEMKYRHYDPAIGRWLLIDPRVENLYELTPYNAFLNDPIRYSDPDGDIPPQLIAGLIGGIWEYGSQVYDNYQNGDTGFDAWVGNVDFADVTTEAVVTGATLGLNKVPGANGLVTVGTEFLKEAVDIKGNGDVDVVGISDNKKVLDVLDNTAKKSIVAATTGKIGKAILKPVKKQAAKALKNSKTEKLVANKRLSKSNNIVKNGSTRVKPENKVLPMDRFKDVVKADQKVQVADVANKVANNQVTEKAVNETVNRTGKSLYQRAKSWWNSLWD